ncbi:hypothetical protein BD780_001959 [Clostridium tetanomorphum]|nr:CBO0543 family protein [Clostridium tetanomorphum]KAJ49825.1 hypothetical protein CTM_21176 [Clostridium tetanomorphum DSM 665]MBP1865127.1 hypothetical protein [Clostridium tetanomorphum]NRS84734.1 hypothetical protein [Clostridium tetanomorphum]NRZ97950.1 hypothetical protein [Clostridium tetanomorphum]SQB91764.1 Uncharacterised protein [Clostridium tetanomorphum]
MLTNFIIGFIIPWILGIFIYFKEKILLFVIAPFFSTVAYTVNTWGFYKDYWSLYPFNLGKVSSVPFDLGLYPVLSVYLVYLIKKSNINAYIVVILFSIFTTFLEALGIIIGKVAYHNGWNIFYTFFSYLFPYILVYYYYLNLKRINILE